MLTDFCGRGGEGEAKLDSLRNTYLHNIYISSVHILAARCIYPVKDTFKYYIPGMTTMFRYV